MKNSIVVLLLIGFLPAFAQQTLTEKFQKITTVPEAQQFDDANEALKPALLNLNSQKDSSLIEERLLRKNKGDIFSVGYVTYKVLEAKEKVAYRASYIFLDGATLTPTQIDSLKKLIQKKYTDGATFTQLSDQYTMDGNTT